MKINLPLKFILLSLSGILTFSTFTSAQTQEWVARYSGTAHQPDEADFIYVDSRGNSFVSGLGYDTTGQRRIIVKYDPTGTQLWVAIDTTYTSYGTGAMTVDANDNVFLTGYVNNYSGSSYDVIKFDSMGVFQWVRYMGSSLQDRGTAITSDANFVYVTGYIYPSTFPPYYDFRTVKLDIATGTTQSGWPKDYNGTGNNNDVPTSIAVDGSGNVFVTGSSINGSGDKDYLTIGYDASGNIITGWPKRWDGPSQTDDTPYQLLLSGSNVIVTGICNQESFLDTAGDIGTIVYTYAGTTVSGWPRIYNDTGNVSDGVGYTNNSYGSPKYEPMAVDGSGNVYIGGGITNTAGDYDIIVLKYNAAGVMQSGFPVIYDNAGNNDIVRGLTLDASDDICITGWTTPSFYNAGGNYITMELDNAGNMMAGWPVIYNGTENGDDQATAITAVGTNIYITGYSNGIGTFQDFTTIKYSNSNPTVNVKSLPASDNETVIYPNPSSGRFTIHGTEPTSQLIISNTLGEVIYQSKVTSLQTQVDISNEAKGIYFYRIIGENNSVQQGKLILL